MTFPIGRSDACQTCGAMLDDSPSDEFCSEPCQAEWHTVRAVAERAGIDNPQAPDTALPEAPPVRPLDWLGTSPERPGYQVLDQVATFVRRFNVFPSEHCAPTLALWYAHTHVVDRFYVTPRLILDSAEPGSGKTRALEVAQYLVAAPEMTISATTAALFRLVAAGPISILFDEVDAIFNPKNGGNSEDLRSLLNAGYKRSATVARCVGDAKNMKVARFPVFAPAALAGIAGGMPATITTRAITIHMRRRRPDEQVEPFRERTVQAQAGPIREALAGWLQSVADSVAEAEPAMPDGVTDRAAEIWEPLLAIADAAGDHWPDTARAACRHFVTDAGPQTTSLGIKLLADLWTLFNRRDTDRIPTVDLLTELCEIEDAPWGELGDRPLDARRLARELSRYGVKPTPFNTGGSTAKGYVTYPTDKQTGLADAWKRYLPQDPTSAGNTSNPGNPPG